MIKVALRLDLGTDRVPIVQRPCRRLHERDQLRGSGW